MTDEADEIRQAFLAMDQSCAGFVGIEDFRTALRSVAPNLSEYVVATAFARIDGDGDGRVSFRDFEVRLRSDAKVCAITRTRLRQNSARVCVCVCTVRSLGGCAIPKGVTNAHPSTASPSCYRHC